MPERYMKACADDFKKPLPAMNDHGLFLSGPAGHGKTHMATAVMRANLDLGIWLNDSYFPAHWHYSGRWIAVPALLSQIKATFNTKGKGERDVVSGFISPKILLLDDVGAQKESDWSLSVLYEILSERINAMRKTIVTSNLTRDEIDALDPRMGSRIGGMTFCHVKDKDWRKVTHGARGNG